MSWTEFAIAIGIALLTEELLGWMDQLAKWLVRHNARQAPKGLVVRLEEEWLACLVNIPGKISRLIFALDCRRAAYIVCHQSRLPNISPLVSMRVRIFDFTCSLFLIAACIPTFILAAVAIRLGGRGPILLQQKRVGLGGRVFSLLSFRTIAIDSRALRPIGRLLQRSNISELPQLLNILRGEMSFVGPLAERPHTVNAALLHISDYDIRHSIKLGITGLAQICCYSRGKRSSLNDPIEQINERHKNDLFLIQNYSLTFVIQLLFQTLGVVLWRAPVKPRYSPPAQK